MLFLINDTKLENINKIIHPCVINEFYNFIDNTKEKKIKLIVIEAALLIEIKKNIKLNHLLLITAKKAVAHSKNNTIQKLVYSRN